MEHVDRVPEFDGVDRTVRVAVMVLDDFENAGTPEPLKWLRVWMTVSDLGEVQREASRILDLFGELPKIVSRRTDEEQRLHVPASMPTLALPCKGESGERVVCVRPRGIMSGEHRSQVS